MNFIALDIYTYIYRVFFGRSKEEIKFRLEQGERGCVLKVLNYINDKYLEKEGDN